METNADIPDDGWAEYYLSHRYATAGGRQVYARDSDSRESYNRDVRGVPFYAINNGMVEYPATDPNRVPIFLRDEASGDVNYPCDLTVNEIRMDEYPVDEATGLPFYPVGYGGRPVYLRDAGGRVLVIVDAVEARLLYAKDVEGNEVYPTTDGRREFALPGKDSSSPAYAKTRDGDEYYPQDDDCGDEFYLMKNGDLTEAGAVRRDVGEFYARRSDGSEFYPKTYRDAAAVKPEEAASSRKQQDSLKQDTRRPLNRLLQRTRFKYPPDRPVLLSRKKRV